MCLWVCLASVFGPMCVFVFVIRVTARKKFLVSKDKNNVLSLVPVWYRIYRTQSFRGNTLLLSFCHT